jgi:hypothetical protein
MQSGTYSSQVPGIRYWTLGDREPWRWPPRRVIAFALLVCEQIGRGNVEDEGASVRSASDSGWRSRTSFMLPVLVFMFSQLAQGSRDLLEKLIVAQLVKKFPAFYKTRKLITMLTRTRDLAISWARWIQSSSTLFKIHFNIVLQFVPRYPKWCLFFRFPPKTFCEFLISVQIFCSCYK